MKVNNRDFSLLLGGQAISQIGDKFHMIALSLWVLTSTGSTAKMGAVLAVSLIPSLILSLFSGAVIDRYNRKIIIVVTDLLRGTIIALFAVFFYFDYMNFYLVLVMQGLLSANAAFFDPAIPSIIPQIVNEDELTMANSLHQFVNGFSTIAGAFLGGIAVAAFGYFAVFAFNGISFMFSAGFETFINIPKQKVSETEKSKSKHIFDDMRDGFSYVFKDKNLVILLFIVMVIHFFVGSIEVFMPVIASIEHGNEASNLGFLQAAFAAGTVIMATILSIKTISGKEKLVLFSAIFFMEILFVISSFFNWNSELTIYAFLIMLLFFGCAVISAYISFRTMMQKKIDNQFAGRVFAVSGAIANASIPGSMIIYGILLEKFDYHSLLLISGLFLIPISIISYMIYKENISVEETLEKHSI
jgi:MFS family permease